MIKAKIIEFLNQIDDLWIDIDFWFLETPQDRTMGDLALPCFSFAKILKKAPQEIATELAEQLNTSLISLQKIWTCAIDTIVATWPYVNFFMNSVWLAENVLNDIKKKKNQFGAGEKKNKTILVEGRSPNTHKMLHVWHLRNALISEAVCHIMDFAWYTVIRTAYGGDIGAHVAKWVWYYFHFTDQSYPHDPHEFSIWSWDIYQQATKKVKENPKEYKAQIHETQRLLESGDDALIAIWEETRALSIAWLQQAFDELWCTIERFYRESEVEKPWIALVKQYEQDPSLPEIKKSQWAIIADLEKYDLWIFVLLKSNGTSLYSTKDIALAYLKEEEYDFDISLYVVATEQNLHFQQLFKTLGLVWYDSTKLVHMWYELVELPDGKMSSRKGTIIPYHVRRRDALAQALRLIDGRDVENKEKVAHSIAFAALKFSFLVQDTYKKIIIDMEKSLSFQWETGPYLQYTATRCASIINKGGEAYKEDVVDYSLLEKEEERILLVLLSEFPAVVAKAAKEYKPHLVARYVLDLAKTFNNYYQKYKIITDDNILSATRLSLIIWIEQVLKNWLHLLGIEILEKM